LLTKSPTQADDKENKYVQEHRYKPINIKERRIRYDQDKSLVCGIDAVAACIVQSIKYLNQCAAFEIIKTLSKQKKAKDIFNFLEKNYNASSHMFEGDTKETYAFSLYDITKLVKDIPRHQLKYRESAEYTFKVFPNELLFFFPTQKVMIRSNIHTFRHKNIPS
jgi:hypothetical protein